MSGQLRGLDARFDVCYAYLEIDTEILTFLVKLSIFILINVVGFISVCCQCQVFYLVTSFAVVS